MSALTAAAIPTDWPATPSRWARLLRVADSYDAMTTRRTYAEARSHETAMRILHAEQHQKIDPEVFRVFEQLMRNADLREA